MNWYCLYCVDCGAPESTALSTTFFTAESDEAALQQLYEDARHANKLGVFYGICGEYHAYLYNTTWTDAEYNEFRKLCAEPCHPLMNPNNRLNQLASFWKELECMTWADVSEV